MKTDKLSVLEKDKKFKKSHLPKNFWLKTPAIYPPACLLFLALLGLLYLLNIDLLISYYAIPFAILFILGTIWLKAMRKAVLKTVFNKENSYLICLAEVLEEKDGWVSMIFTTSTKRHNKYYIKTVAKDIKEEGFAYSIGDFKHKAQQLETDDSIKDEKVYLTAFKKSEMKKQQTFIQEADIVPVLFIDAKNVLLLKPKDIN